jgi:hypothetical protein
LEDKEKIDFLQMRVADLFSWHGPGRGGAALDLDLSKFGSTLVTASCLGAWSLERAF